jgi:hypothetical protein
VKRGAGLENVAEEAAAGGNRSWQKKSEKM